MFASMHLTYEAHLASSFFSLPDKVFAYHMIHIQLWGSAPENMTRFIGVVCIFLSVSLCLQQELVALGLSVNVQVFISYAIKIKQTACVSIIIITLASLLTLISSPQACASVY
jgi:hypothetical protein